MCWFKSRPQNRILYLLAGFFSSYTTPLIPVVIVFINHGCLRLYIYELLKGHDIALAKSRQLSTSIPFSATTGRWVLVICVAYRYYLAVPFLALPGVCRNTPYNSDFNDRRYFRNYQHLGLAAFRKFVGWRSLVWLTSLKQFKFILLPHGWTVYVLLTSVVVS